MIVFNVKCAPGRQTNPGSLKGAAVERSRKRTPSYSFRRRSGRKDAGPIFGATANIVHKAGIFRPLLGTMVCVAFGSMNHSFSYSRVANGC
jgi:hypothetical protein